MKIQPEISTCSIVLLGQFNPAIFQPEWLKAMNIESENTNPESDLIIHNEIANFSIDTRSYLVQPTRFKIATDTAPWVRILDITYKIFTEHLNGTPIRAFGVNFEVHFKLRSFESRTKLGRILAPIEPWEKFGAEMDTEEKEMTGGLWSLTMKKKAQNISGSTRETYVKIEPSVRIKDNKGVYMNVNAHHQLTDLPEGYGSELGITLLSKRFDSSMVEANTIIDAMMKKGLSIC